ncbi:MAG: DUF1735 and LamG domain-containing protein [Bacteroidales bacterium]|nr:DUF1735 and LamG domain-containing protein [Bacteroides sp.]MCM1198653.1 DUF1735 and LamG domain-containing protein [Clostridium sp.]MCM1503204.1 DUF1735 and LamG domain-containing protein [Bacteroidales bacterium]
MKRISRIIATLGLCGAVLAGCQDKEAELLVSKVYFEDAQSLIELDEEATHTIDLKSRLTTMYDSDVNVTYTIEGEDVVKAYNEKYGKEYKVFTTAGLANETSVIKAGDVYSASTDLYLNELAGLVDGDSYLLPVRVNTGDVPVIDGSNITYFEVKRPLKIMRAARFNSSYITLPLTPLDVFTDVTYEAVINVASFGNNNTVMGCEGVMIMRIGDAGGGTVPRDVLQMAGKSEITLSDSPIKSGLWYHLAFTCASDGTANLYVNGEKVVSNGSFTMSSDLTANGADYGFSIGQVPNFMWGTRPFNGYMSEIRLWNVVRSDSQIKENMLSVDPASDGLVAYYKLNGNEVVNATGGPAPKTVYRVNFVDLENPIAIGAGL